MPTIDSLFDFMKRGGAAEFYPVNTVWAHGRTSLYRFMIRNGFEFAKSKSQYELSLERVNIISMRENCLLRIEKYREEGYEIFYQDETWSNKNMALALVWQDGTGLKIHYKVPSGKGDRFIIFHIGSGTTGSSGWLFAYVPW
eukprot:IDg9602t1